MRTESELKGFIREGIRTLAREKDLAAFEIYCSSSEHRVARLNYTSEIPSRGVEEFKSLNADGFALRIVMRNDAHQTGSASCAGDLSVEALHAMLVRARQSLVSDPHFPGLPRDAHKLPKTAGAGALMRVGDAGLAAAAWRIIGGALDAFKSCKLARPGLVIGGDLSLIRDRIALG
ncbi:MAG: hypothetical protein ACREQE_10880, partial [Candidatus Binataceae bacterium]